jgi:serine/threonine protein kinase
VIWLQIGDMGSSRLMVDTSTSFVGTPLYMAPEVLQQHPYSLEMDIWSLGSVLYEMCTLQVPFVARTLDVLKVACPTYRACGRTAGECGRLRRERGGREWVLRVYVSGR